MVAVAGIDCLAEFLQHAKVVFLVIVIAIVVVTGIDVVTAATPSSVMRRADLQVRNGAAAVAAVVVERRVPRKWTMVAVAVAVAVARVLYANVNVNINVGHDHGQEIDAGCVALALVIGDGRRVMVGR